LWRAAAQIAGVIGIPSLIEGLNRGSYKEVKEGDVLSARRAVKSEVKREALRGWVKNNGDDAFSLEVGIK
jgi:tRNA-specific adenosine deaminase 1